MNVTLILFDVINTTYLTDLFRETSIDSAPRAAVFPVTEMGSSCKCKTCLEPQLHAFPCF